MATRFSICNFTLLPVPWLEQVDVIARAGASGMGVCEGMLPSDVPTTRLTRHLDAAGLAATVCLPALLSPLPLTLFPGPDDPAERVVGLQESVRRLAPFRPEAIAILTGPQGPWDAGEARRIALEGIAAVNEVAKAEGVRLALEPIHKADHGAWSLVWDIPQTVTLLDELGDDNVGILVDVFHLWDTPNVEEEIRAAGPRVAAVHVNDRGVDHRSWADRRIMGDGIAPVVGIVRAAEAAGYRGHYDCEIFSDNGSFGVADYDDSLWDLPADDLVRRCVQGWENVADAAGVTKG